MNGRRCRVVHWQHGCSATHVHFLFGGFMQCEICGIGFFLPSGTCDHCNTRRHTMLSITVSLTDRECDALAELSRELDLPQDRVLIQALRHYQASRHPVSSLPMMAVSDSLCYICGIGFRLPSGRCDICDSRIEA